MNYLALRVYLNERDYLNLWKGCAEKARVKKQSKVGVGKRESEELNEEEQK